MSTPYLSEIRIFTFNFPPKGWAFCDGQLLPINQNQAVFALLGTNFGGNGIQTFALPNLQGRMPMHMGTGFTLGQAAGEEAHTLTLNELPAHSHAARASTSGATVASPINAAWADGGKSIFAVTPNTTMVAAAMLATGGSQPHNNLAPYLALNFCIALQGIFPSQS